MSIDRLGQYGGFYDSYAVSEPKLTTVEEVRRQEEALARQPLPQQTTELLPQNQTASPRQDTRSCMADLENISLTFNGNETFDYIGQDASLENLDMMRAISDMQKDKVLEQYQYFVGPKDLSGVITAGPDGIVIQK